MLPCLAHQLQACRGGVRRAGGWVTQMQQHRSDHGAGRGRGYRMSHVWGHALITDRVQSSFGSRAASGAGLGRHLVMALSCTPINQHLRTSQPISLLLYPGFRPAPTPFTPASAHFPPTWHFPQRLAQCSRHVLEARQQLGAPLGPQPRQCLQGAAHNCSMHFQMKTQLKGASKVSRCLPCSHSAKKSHLI